MKLGLITIFLLLPICLYADEAPTPSPTAARSSIPVMLQVQLGNPVELAVDLSAFAWPHHNLGLGAYLGGGHGVSRLLAYGQKLALHPRYRYYWIPDGWGPFLQAGGTWEERSYPGGYPVVPPDSLYAADLGFGAGFTRRGHLNFDLMLNASVWSAPSGTAFVLGAALGLGWVF